MLRARPLVQHLGRRVRRFGSCPYDTLGVPPTATRAEAKEAYLRLAKQHHPDRSGDATRFRAIADAWEIIGDKAKRALHDEAHKPRWEGDAAAASRARARANARTAAPVTSLERLFGPGAVLLALGAAAGCICSTPQARSSLSATSCASTKPPPTPFRKTAAEFCATQASST